MSSKVSLSNLGNPSHKLKRMHKMNDKFDVYPSQMMKAMEGICASADRAGKIEYTEKCRCPSSMCIFNRQPGSGQDSLVSQKESNDIVTPVNPVKRTRDKNEQWQKKIRRKYLSV